MLRPVGLDFVVAKASKKLSAAINSPQESGPRCATKITIAVTVALVAPLLSTSINPCQAADFRHAKKVIVPASSIPRRYDYDSAAGREAGLPSGYGSDSGGSSYTPYSYDSSSSTSSSSSSGKSKNGLVPPPPPVTPTILNSDVPPPPMAPSIVSRGAAANVLGFPIGAAGSTLGIPPASGPGATSTSASGFQQINADPTRLTPLQRQLQQQQSQQSGSSSAAQSGSVSQSGSFHPSKQVADATSVHHILTRADVLVKEGKLQEAQDLLEKHEKSYPHNTQLTGKLSEICLDRAKYYMRHDEFVEGAKQARLAIAYNSANTEARQALEQILRHHGIEPQHSLSRVKLGDVLFSQGKMKEARVEYDAALKADHSSAAYIGLGNIALREHKIKEAKNHYQLALEKEPNSHIALRQLGIAKYKQRDVVGASVDLSKALMIEQSDKIASQTLIELWQRQVSLRPKDANSHLGLARAYQLSGDLKSAQNSYRTVVSIDPNHPNLPAARQSFKLALAKQEALKTYEMAKTLDTNGAIREAYQKASESVTICPTEVKFKIYQAELAERLGNLPEAKHEYLEVLRMDPKNHEAALKIKAIAEILAAREEAQSLRGPIGMTAQAGSLAQGASPGLLAGLLGTPKHKEGPPAPTIPAPPGVKGPSPDPVNNMSGFLGELRNYMVVQKKQLQKQEDIVHENVGFKEKTNKMLGSANLPPPGAANLPPLPDMPDMPKNLITSSDIQKLLAGTGTAGSAAKPAAGVAAQAANAPAKGASSVHDINKLLTGGHSSTPMGTAAGVAQSAPSVAPPIGGVSAAAASGLAGMAGSFGTAGGAGAVGVPSSQGMITPQDVSRILNNTSGSPPWASQSAAPFGGTQSNSILSSPTRDSETVLKVADEVQPAPRMVQNQMPEVAPPIAQTLGGLVATPQALPLPQTVQVPAAAPPQGFATAVPGAAGQGFAAVAPGAAGQGLSPAALAGIARSLGMSPEQMTAFANQALAQAPQLISATPQLLNAAPQFINQQLAHLKQEDIDKVYKLIKEHTASKQSVKGIVTSNAVANKPGATGTAKTGTTVRAPGKTTATKPTIANKTAAKPTVSMAKQTVAKAKTTTPAKPVVATKVAQNNAVKKPVSPSAQTEQKPAIASAAVPQEESKPLAAQTPTEPMVSESSFDAAENGSNESPSAVPTPTGSNDFAVNKVDEPVKETVVPAGQPKQRLDSLEAQNKDLQSQLENTRKELQELRESFARGSAKPARAKRVKPDKVSKNAETKPVTISDAKTGNMQPEIFPTPPVTATPTEPVESVAEIEAELPKLSEMATKQLGLPVPEAVQNFASSSNVNLELTGISVRPRGVRLNVVLRNSTGQEMALPSSTKAIVRMVGAPDQIAEVKFPVKSLVAGQEVKGYIGVSGHKLDPAADVFIPKLMSGADGPKDVHLTVPISAINSLIPQ